MKNSFIDFQIFAFPDTKNQAENWQGAGNSKLLILYDQSEALAEEDLTFLQNILQAVKINSLADQVYLASCTAQQKLPLAQLARQEEIETVILFGSAPEWAGIRALLPYYSFTRLGDLSLLRAHSLTQIRKERAANKNENAGALWNALKAKFL